MRAGWLLGAALLAAGCGGGLGDFCTRDDDCKRGLSCVARPGARGVCTYPPGPVEAGPLDATPDRARDLAPDRPRDRAPDHPRDQAREPTQPDLPPSGG